MIYRDFCAHTRGAILTLLATVTAAAGAAAPATTTTTTTPSPAPALTPPAATAPTAPTAPAAAPATPVQAAIEAPLQPAQVIDVLDQTIDWYRSLGVQQQAANEPSDLLFLYDNRQTANKVVTLAFEIARGDAELLAHAPQAPAPAPSGSDAVDAPQALLQVRHKLDGQAATIQAELDAERRQAAGTSRQHKAQVQAKLNELEGELDLVNTKRGILDTMTGFTADGGSSGAADLKAQIDAMAVAIPSSASAQTTTPGTAQTSPAPATQAGPLLATSAQPSVGQFGLWDLAANAFRLSEKAASIASIDVRTQALQATLTQVQQPLLDQIKRLSAHGDALAAQAGSADSTTLNGVRDQLDTLSGQFKQLSALLIPLSREGILLSEYRRNLTNWQTAIKAQYRAALKTLGIRALVLGVILTVLFAAAELWRRTVVRYIQDSRRRYQLLLLRRIALWSLVVLVIGFAFASELGSIVTFAGLITAGIAVAMQSVLVSIVGYFFLIGKYGIRVGDRVQIGEVAGEVIDLGLVRMYLMELGAKGTLGPTGRVVAFANSVVFQVASGLFKQIPGVNLGWREVVVNLPSAADHSALKDELLASVNEALREYHPEILRQTREIERTTLLASAGDAKPQVQLHFSGSAVEAHVRYPVHMPKAAEIDERVTAGLARVIQAAAAGAGTAT